MLYICSIITSTLQSNLMKGQKNYSTLLKSHRDSITLLYNQSTPLGITQNAIVYEGICVQDQKQIKIALKFYKDSIKPSKNLQFLMNKNLENVVKIMDISYFSPSFIIMQFCDKNLKNVIYGKKAVSYEKIMSYLQGITQGLLSLKKQHIIYGDIKPQNILLDSDQIKIGDLDYIVREEQIKNINLKVGTFAYMAPEMIFEWKCSYMSDIWSLGVLIYEILFKKNPFDTCIHNKSQNPEHFINHQYKSFLEKTLIKIRKQLKSILKQQSNANIKIILKLILDCLQLKPQKRIELEQINKILSENNSPRKLSSSTQVSLQKQNNKQEDYFDYLSKSGISKQLQKMLILLAPEQFNKKYSSLFALIKEIDAKINSKVSKQLIMEQILQLKTQLANIYGKLKRNLKRLLGKQNESYYSSSQHILVEIHNLLKVIQKIQASQKQT